MVKVNLIDHFASNWQRQDMWERYNIIIYGNLNLIDNFASNWPRQDMWDDRYLIDNFASNWPRQDMCDDRYINIIYGKGVFELDRQLCFKLAEATHVG